MAAHKHYTNIDIERYLQKQMTLQEMHDFEKAMHEDPFLADAIEGYMKSDLALTAGHLRQIEKEVYGKKEQAKIVPIISSAKVWRSRAAIIILLAGIGIATFYLLNGSIKAPQISETTSVSIPPASDSQPVLQQQSNQAGSTADEKTALASKKPAAAPSLLERKTPDPVSDDQNEKTSTETARHEEAIVLLNNKQEAREISSRAARSKAEETNSSRAKEAVKEFEIKGKVTDEAGEPVGFATISTPRGQAAIADANGNFKIKSTDSVAMVDINSLGYQAEKARVDQKANNRVTLKEESKSLSEMVVTGMKKSKDQKTTKYGHLNNSTIVFPVDGWPWYYDYLDSSVRLMNDTLTPTLHGEVELVFMVDKDGRPQKINVKKSSDNRLNPYAIDILKNGSDWQTTKKEKKGLLTIIF